MATRVKQDRTRASGFRGSLNTQDYAPLALSPAARAVTLFCNVAALLAGEGAYYDALPPAAQMATRAVKDAAKLMQGEVQG